MHELQERGEREEVIDTRVPITKKPMPDRLNKLFIVLDREMKVADEWKATDDLFNSMQTMRRIIAEICAEIYK